MRKFDLIFITFFSLIVLLALSDSAFSQYGTIKGRVYNAKNNQAVPFANIIISASKTGITSDLAGNFQFDNVKSGYVILIATYVGFDRFVSNEYMVTGEKTTFIDIPMHETEIKLAEVEIRAKTFRRDEESPLSMRSIGIAEIEKTPGSNRDISRVIQSLPGVSSTPSFRNDVIVRGGGSGENRFYLDGIEIPNLNHFYTQGSSGGSVGIVNVDFLREIELYSSAFPANQGNALSSILDMRLIDGNPDNLKTKISLGASDLALTLEGPVSKKTSFIASARRSYLQFLFSAIGLPFLPTYNDFQWKSKTKFNQKNELTIIGIGAIDNSELNTGIKNPNENQKFILGYLPVYKQWDYAIGGVYKHFSKNYYDTYVLSRNMLRNISYKYPDNDESKPKILDYTSDEIENKFRFERNQHATNYKLNVGFGIEYDRYSTNTFQKFYTNKNIIDINYSSSFDLIAWNTFAQYSRTFLGNRLSLSFGIRIDANNYNSEMANLLKQFSPRLAASYSINEHIFFNTSIGRYFQRPAYTTMGFRNNTGVLANKNNDITYISADHFVAGFDYLLDGNSKLSVEGFLKSYLNYPFSVNDSISLASKGTDFGTVGNEEVTSSTKGRAYGFEIYYRNIDLNAFNIILSYTFVRSEFTGKYGQYIPSSWDNSHLLNITVKRDLGKNWDMGLKWRFVGGAPYTPIDVEKSSIREVWDTKGSGYLNYSAYNTERLKSFNQLDVRIDKQYYYRKWSLNFYLDIQNVLSYRSEQPPIYTNLDESGNPAIDPNDNSKYLLRKINDYSATILPTIGIIIEF